MRHEKRWSQGDIAKDLDISVAAYSKIETNVTDISLSRLEQLASLFNISIIDIIEPLGEIRQPPMDELSKALDIIAEQKNKIVHLQEYVISLYEQLNKEKVN